MIITPYKITNLSWPYLVWPEKNFAKTFCIFDQKFRVVNEV